MDERDAEEALLAQLATEGRRLVEAFVAGDPAVQVPGLEWSAREVVAHAGAVHRWSADIVRRTLATNETGGSRAFAFDGADAALVDWYSDGLEQLIMTLQAAPAGLACYTLIPGVPGREFWIRRQAHETAIHRVDVEAATGESITAVEPWFAQDGLGELVGAFAREPHFALRRPGCLLLAASDGPWWKIDFDPEANRVATGMVDLDDATAVVSGTSDELYRWAWNRPVAGLQISGDDEVVAAWQATVRIG